MATRVIPIEPGEANQRLQVELDGLVFGLLLQWNDRDDAWWLSIATESGDLIVSGIRVIANTPLLRQFVGEAMPEGELTAIDTRSPPSDPPGLDELGDVVLLVYEEAT
jgi:hypothetical protein